MGKDKISQAIRESINPAFLNSEYVDWKTLLGIIFGIVIFFLLFLMMYFE